MYNLLAFILIRRKNNFSDEGMSRRFTVTLTANNGKTLETDCKTNTLTQRPTNDNEVMKYIYKAQIQVSSKRY